MGTDFQFYIMTRAMPVNGIDGCTTLQVSLISLNCVLKMVKMVNFVVCILKVFKWEKLFFLVTIFFLGQSLENCKASVGSRVFKYELHETDVPVQLLSRWGDIPSASYSTITPNPPTRIL